MKTDSATATPSTASPSSSTSSNGAADAAVNSPAFRRDGEERAPQTGATPSRGALIALAVALLIAAGIVAVLVTRGTGAAPDGAAKLVPPDALLYAHVATSPTREPDVRLRALLGRFPALRGQLLAVGAQLSPAAGKLDFARDVRPWLGDEAGIALLDAGAGRSQPLLVAAVADRPKAQALLDRLGATADGAQDGVALRRLRPGIDAAFAGTYLAVGPVAAVRAVIDRVSHHGPSLAGTRAYRDATESRRDGAAADVFAPAAGLHHLLDGRGGLAGLVSGLLAGPQLEAVAAQAEPVEGGVSVTGHVVRTPGGPARAQFAPGLEPRAPSDAAAFLDLPSVGAAAALVSRMGGAPLLAGLRDALPAEAGVELGDLLAPLKGEAAMTIEPGDAAPVFTLAARTTDPGRTRTQLAMLQQPLARRLGSAQPFQERDAADGAPAFTLPVTPELQPSYGLDHGVVVASSTRAGLGQLQPARSSVASAPALAKVAPHQGDKVQALGLFAPRQLLSLGQQGGLTALVSPAARDDLSRIRSAGVAVEEDASHPTDTTARLFLQIP